MTALTAQMPLDLSPIHQAISMFGIPNPIEYLQQADADPDVIRGGAEALNQTALAAETVATEVQTARGQAQWSGEAALSFSGLIDGLLDFLNALADGLLGVVEFVFKAIEAIVNLFIVICTILIAAATIITAIIVAAVAAAVVTFGGSLAAAAKAVFAVVSTKIMTIIGLIGVVATILRVILELLNTFVGWLIDGVGFLREQLA